VNAEVYAARQKQHAPNTIEEVRAATYRVLDEEFSDQGIAAALALAAEQVRRLLGCASCE
jgi:hypothetical protein